MTVPNVGHVTALADYADCASGIVRRFLDTLQPGDVTCAQATPEIHVVPEFPRKLAGIPLTGVAVAGDHSNAGDRRGAWAANWTVGDALARWWLIYGSRGHGLRGGSFTASGEYLAYSPVRLRLRRVRFVSDLAVSGSVEWNRREGTVRARLRLAGARRGTLGIAWSTRATRALASITGTIGGRSVRLSTPAP